MSKVLNFNTLKRKTMTIIMNDEEQTKLSICVPKKEMLDNMIALKDVKENEESVNMLYEVCAELINNNREGKAYTVEELKEMLEFEDLLVFVQYFTDFINEVQSSKN